MLPVSPNFLAAIRGSHDIVSQCLLLTPPGVTGTRLIGQSLKIISGTVTLDYTANPRGTMDITVMEPWPIGNSTAALTPYGTEVAVSRGIQFANGNTESAPLGIYRLSDVEQQDAPRGALRLTGQDRMAQIIDSKLLPSAANYFAAGTLAGALMDTLVGQVYPWASAAAGTILWDDTSATGSGYALPRGLFADQDRFQFIDDLVKSLGKVWYFDYRGILIIKTPPTGGAPVWSADAGPQGVLVSAQRNLTRQNVFNTVVVTGQALDNLPPPAQIARDNDPTSVTYVGGAFGVVPLYYNAPGVTNSVQALTAATTQLQLVKGLPYVVGFSQVPNPALEPYDLVQLVYPLDLTQITHRKVETHYLQQVTIGLGSDTTMVCATRLSTNSGMLQ